MGKAYKFRIYPNKQRAEPIVHLPPPLTDEQRDLLRTLYMIGYPWLAKNYSGAVYAYEYKPNKSNSGYWQIDIEGRFRVLPSLCICKLVSSSDPEPYDIGKALGVKK